MSSSRVKQLRVNVSSKEKPLEAVNRAINYAQRSGIKLILSPKSTEKVIKFHILSRRPYVRWDN